MNIYKYIGKFYSRARFNFNIIYFIAISAPLLLIFFGVIITTINGKISKLKRQQINETADDAEKNKNIDINNQNVNENIQKNNINEASKDTVNSDPYSTEKKNIINQPINTPQLLQNNQNINQL